MGSEEILDGTPGIVVPWNSRQTKQVETQQSLGSLLVAAVVMPVAILLTGAALLALAAYEAGLSATEILGNFISGSAEPLTIAYARHFVAGHVIVAVLCFLLQFIW